MASKSLGTLTLDLIAKIGGFIAPMDQAQRKSKESMSKIAGYAKTAATAFAAAGVAIGASAAAMAKSGIDTADALLDISDATGIATEQLSALKYAADIEEISLDKLSGTLNKFSKTVSEAADGVGAGADAFAALGVSVTNSDGSLRDSYSILGDVSEAISQLENGADKAAVAQQLFGKSGAQLLPILNGGRQGLQDYADQAERLNLIISRDTAEASAEFNDNLKDLKLALGGVGLTIAEEVAPRLAELTDTLTDETTQQGLATFADGFARVASLAVDAAAGLGNFSSFLNRAINGPDPQNLRQVSAEIENIQSVLDSPIKGRLNPLLPTRIAIQDEEELRKSLERLLAIREQIIAESGQKSLEAELNAQGWEDAFNNERPKAFGVTQSGAEAAKKENEEAARAVEELNRQYEAMVATLHQQNMLSAEATELEKVRYDYTYGSLKGINDQQKQVLDDMARERDLQIETAELNRDLVSVKQELLSEEERYREAAEDRLATLNDALRAGIISEEEYGRLIVANTEKVGEQIEKLKDKQTELDEFTKNAARSIQSSLSDAIMAGFDGGADDLLDRWNDLLKRMVADAIAADLTRALFGQNVLGGGQFGTDQLFAGVTGIFAGMFDAGGTIPNGKVGIVGERGPELVRGPATVTGRLDTARQLNAPGIGNITMNFPGVTNAQEARKAAGAAGRELLAVLNGAQRYT